MGRCYEFGVEIHAGCEHAMVVTAEGGACECNVCSTVCPGRFAGCAAVVAIPGRVPPSAPAWATPSAGESDRHRQPAPPRPLRPSAEHAAAQAVRNGAPLARRAPEPPPPAVGLPAPQPIGNGVRAAAQAPVNGPLAEVLTLLTKLVEEQAAHPTAVLVEVVEGMRDEVRDRDDQLATSLEHYASYQRQLATSLEDYAAYQRQLAEYLAHMVEAVDKLAAVVSDDLQRMGAATERLAAGMASVEEKLSKPATVRDLLGRRS
ncbi:MAG: hypothetical protein ACR2MO_12065 [Acidimicrobiales bacterium]